MISSLQQRPNNRDNRDRNHANERAPSYPVNALHVAISGVAS